MVSGLSCIKPPIVKSTAMGVEDYWTRRLMSAARQSQSIKANNRARTRKECIMPNIQICGMSPEASFCMATGKLDLRPSREARKLKEEIRKRLVG